MLYQNQKGFTLIEVAIVAGITAITLTGMVKLFIFTSIQSELAGNQTLALCEAQDKIEEIRNHTFGSISADYASGGTPGNTFNLTLLDGTGVVYIDASNPELLEIEIVIAWRDKHDRIIGEDTNLNGNLNTGEDKNGNSQLDSPVAIKSFITRR